MATSMLRLGDSPAGVAPTRFRESAQYWVNVGATKRAQLALALRLRIPFGLSVGHEPNAEDHPNRYENPSKRSVTIRNSSKVGHRGRSRCTIHLDHPSIAITRAYQRARNNWHFDPQGIERSTNAGGMDSLDTC